MMLPMVQQYLDTQALPRRALEVGVMPYSTLLHRRFPAEWWAVDPRLESGAPILGLEPIAHCDFFANFLGYGIEEVPVRYPSLRASFAVVFSIGVLGYKEPFGIPLGGDLAQPREYIRAIAALLASGGMLVLKTDREWAPEGAVHAVLAEWTIHGSQSFQDDETGVLYDFWFCTIAST